MEQIDALRAMLADATPGEWHSLGWCEVCTDADDDDTVCETRTQENARLIAAMHNALPDLLDATEMVEALTWVWNTIGDCEACPHRKGCFEEPNVSWCNGGIFDHAAEWLAAWRERKTDASSI